MVHAITIYIKRTLTKDIKMTKFKVTVTVISLTKDDIIQLTRSYGKVA